MQASSHFENGIRVVRFYRHHCHRHGPARPDEPSWGSWCKRSTFEVVNILLDSLKRLFSLTKLHQMLEVINANDEKHMRMKQVVSQKSGLASQVFLTLE